jgi:para-nitrobenzyl esterase
MSLRHALCALGLAALPLLAGAADGPVARTPSGDVAGRFERTVSVFRGLPYAAAPVGERRWQAPGPAPRWTGLRDGSAAGPACTQVPGMSLENGGDVGRQSEDCLYLDIWTPDADPAARRPVMVWIHGGALVFGSGHLALYDGGQLARQDVVVVTINYRLGALGFFAHPALGDGAPMNFGLLDQIAALRWLRTHVAAFGGDPDNITVFGQSAGAQSVLALYASPLARGLFHRGIAQSPYGIPSHPRKRARAAAIAVADGVGLPGAKASLAQLRAVPAARLFEVADKAANLAPGFIVGDAALPDPILETFQRGRQAALPLIIGNTSDDGSVAIAFGIDPAALMQRLRAGRVLVEKLHPGVEDDALLGREVMRDLVFTAFARRIAYLQSQRAPTWRYYFSHRAPDSRAPGVPHGGDVPYVFGTGDRCGCLPKPMRAQDWVMAAVVGDYWTQFARAGEPSSPRAPPWPRDGIREPRTLELGSEGPIVRPDFLAPRLNAYIGLLKAGGFLAPR